MSGGRDEVLSRINERKKAEKLTKTGISVPASVWEAFKKAVADERHSINEIVTAMIEIYLEKSGTKKDHQKSNQK